MIQETSKHKLIVCQGFLLLEFLNFLAICELSFLYAVSIHLSNLIFKELWNFNMICNVINCHDDDLGNADVDSNEMFQFSLKFFVF